MVKVNGELFEHRCALIYAAVSIHVYTHRGTKRLRGSEVGKCFGPALCVLLVHNALGAREWTKVRGIS